MQLERGGEREHEGYRYHQEGIGEGCGVERVQRVESFRSCFSSRRQERADDRGSGSAAEEEEGLVDPKSYTDLFSPQCGCRGVGGGGVGEGEPRAQTEHTRRYDDGWGTGPEGREKEYGDQHNQEAREDGWLHADAVGEASGERGEDCQSDRARRQRERRGPARELIYRGDEERNEDQARYVRQHGEEPDDDGGYEARVLEQGRGDERVGSGRDAPGECYRR